MQTKLRRKNNILPNCYSFTDQISSKFPSTLSKISLTSQPILVLRRTLKSSNFRRKPREEEEEEENLP